MTDPAGTTFRRIGEIEPVRSAALQSVEPNCLIPPPFNLKMESNHNAQMDRADRLLCDVLRHDVEVGPQHRLDDHGDVIMHQLDDDTPAISSAERLALLIADALDAFSEPKNWIMPKATFIGPQPSLPIWKTHTSGIADPAAHAAAALSALGELAEAIKPSDPIAALPAQGVRVKPDRETFDAMCAMRNSINEYIPMPSLESDLLQGPENGVFCATVAETVIAEVLRLRSRLAALEPSVAGGVEARTAEHWRGKFRWLMWRIMWAQEKCLSHDLPDDVFAFLEADSADLRDNSFTCECGSLVHHEDAFMCDDGPTLCFRCKPGTAALEPAEAGAVEARKCPYDAKGDECCGGYCNMAGADDPADPRDAPAEAGGVTSDDPDYPLIDRICVATDCRPSEAKAAIASLRAPPAAPDAVEALVKAAENAIEEWERCNFMEAAVDGLRAALAAYRGEQKCQS